jgi:transposase
MAITDRHGLPVALHVDSARPHEVKLVGKTLEGRFLVTLPKRLIGDKAYDSDPLDAELGAYGIEMIAPHRRGRKNAKTQDGRPLRRYRRRWKVERFFAWLQCYRRITTRWEYHLHNFRGMVQIGCILILLKSFLG